MTRVLVFGSTGQIARELARTTWPQGTTLTLLDRAAADFADPQSLGPLVRRNRPDIVIVAAAYTNVDAAEDDEEAANLINAVAPGAIARAAAELSIPIVHLSTDYVFDGEKGAPYVETDAVNPINAYGRTKLAGEREVRAANSKHLILRSSWIYSAFERNFFRTMLRLAESRDEVSVVADQRGCPTAAHDLAAGISANSSSPRRRRRTLGDIPFGRRIRHDLAWLCRGNLLCPCCARIPAASQQGGGNECLSDARTPAAR